MQRSIYHCKRPSFIQEQLGKLDWVPTVSSSRKVFINQKAHYNACFMHGAHLANWAIVNRWRQCDSTWLCAADAGNEETVHSLPCQVLLTASSRSPVVCFQPLSRPCGCGIKSQPNKKESNIRKIFSTGLYFGDLTELENQRTSSN